MKSCEPRQDIRPVRTRSSRCTQAQVIVVANEMKKLRGILLGLLIFVGKSAGFARRYNNHQLRQFNAGGDVYYVPAGDKLTGTVKLGLECLWPNVGYTANAEFTCTSSGCRLQCNRGYSMDHGRRLYINCDSNTGVLTLDGRPWDENLPPCLPRCNKGCAEGWTCVAPNECEKVTVAEVPTDGNDYDFDFGCDAPCQNGGTCIDFIGECNCPEGYTGEVCQTHICTAPGEAPAHATISATNNLTKMKIECETGFKMKSGLTTQGFKCHHGIWVSEDKQQSYDADELNCSA
ncbi:neurogenic locus notch homolog protein 1-like isoform X2 [Macrobrachium rosenbergii]